MPFDVDQHHSTVCPPWSFTRDGQTYQALHVSAPAVERFLADFNGATDAVAKDRALYRLLRLAYPDRLSYCWRRWTDPVDRLLTLDAQTRGAALADFFAFLGIQFSIPDPQTPQTASMPFEASTGVEEAVATASRS